MMSALTGSPITATTSGEHGHHAKDRSPDSGTREDPQRIHFTDFLLAACIRPVLAEGTLRFTCSGQIPNAIMRAGRSRTGRRRRSALAGVGSEGAPSGPRSEEITRRWTTDWKACIA